MAGGFNKPKKTPYNFYKLQISSSALQRQQSRASATFLHVHFCNKTWLFFIKTNRARFPSKPSAQVWLQIWPSELALNGKKTWHTRMHRTVGLVELWLRNGCAFLHESDLIPKVRWSRRWRTMPPPPVQRHFLALCLESHLQPLTLIQCNLKWIQLDSVTFNSLTHSVLLSSITGT